MNYNDLVKHTSAELDEAHRLARGWSTEASVAAARAQTYATLAVAERLDKIIEMLFDEGRAIRTTGEPRI